MTAWKPIGHTGAFLFAARWLVQLVATRRAGRPGVLRLFWIMSITGGVMALSYFLSSAKRDPAGVLQNLFPAITALYCLHLGLRHERTVRAPPDAG